MKKLKILPSILMLVLCVGVLAVGVFAITPTKNQITGSITINASNPAIEITAYNVTLNASGEEVSRAQIGSTVTSRAGVDIPLGNLSFNLQNANKASDVIDLKVVLSVHNTSSEPLGAYFATSSNATASTKTPAVKLHATAGTTTIYEAVKASFTNYTSLPAGETAEVALTFSLLKLQSTQATINLNNCNLYLNIEDVNSALLPIETDKYSYYAGTLTLKAGAGSGDFTNAKMTEIKNDLTSKGVTWADVTDFNFGTSEFTAVNGGLDGVNFNTAVLSDKITTVYDIRGKIARLWVPQETINWRWNNYGGSGIFDGHIKTAYNYTYEEESVEAVYRKTITIFFEAENDNDFKYYVNYGGDWDGPTSGFGEQMVAGSSYVGFPFGGADSIFLIENEDYFYGVSYEEFLQKLEPMENELYYYEDGKVTLKAGAGSGDFTATKMAEIETSLKAEGLYKYVTDFDFGESKFTSIKGGLDDCWFNSVVLNNSITTMYNIRHAFIDKLWVPNSVVNWWSDNMDGAGIFCCWIADYTYDGWWTNLKKTINVYFEAENSNDFNCRISMGEGNWEDSDFDTIVKYFDYIAIDYEAQELQYLTENEDYFFNSNFGEFLIK